MFVGYTTTMTLTVFNADLWSSVGRLPNGVSARGYLVLSFEDV